MSFYDPDKIEVLITEEQIQDRVRELGAQITKDFRGQGELVLVCVLRGSYLFLADLSRAIDLDLTVDFMSVSSYGDAYESSGVVRLINDLSEPIANKHVLIVEDIIDSGLTMSYIIKSLETRNPQSVSIVSMLHKPSKTKVKLDIRYLGFEIPDRFVIGYGLDFHNKLRNLPFIGVNLAEGMPLNSQ